MGSSERGNWIALNWNGLIALFYCSLFALFWADTFPLADVGGIKWTKYLMEEITERKKKEYGRQCAEKAEQVAVYLVGKSGEIGAFLHHSNASAICPLSPIKFPLFLSIFGLITQVWGTWCFLPSFNIQRVVWNKFWNCVAQHCWVVLKIMNN